MTYIIAKTSELYLAIAGEWSASPGNKNRRLPFWVCLPIGGKPPSMIFTNPHN